MGHTYDNNTSSKQSKYKYTMKFTRLIASTLMLLVVLMASTASARSIASPEPQKFCCNAISAQCEACKAGVSVEEICRTWGVEPSHPDNCYSSIWQTEIRHGELGAKKCCWYGKWEKKSKCEKNPPVTHPDNCYSSIWNTEIRHGEMGAKKCCWY